MAPRTDLSTFVTESGATIVLAAPVRQAVRIGSLRTECCGPVDVWADHYGVQADCPHTDAEPWLPTFDADTYLSSV